MGIITQMDLSNIGLGKDQLPIIWEGQYYYDIQTFDCRIVRLQPHRIGGGYTTVLPISPLEYRKKNPTKAKVVIINKEEREYVDFHCYNDYGGCSIMSIPKYMVEKIEVAKFAAKEQELLETD